MQLGMVGLGKMGANMTHRLVRGGHQLVVSDLSADAVKQLVGDGATGSTSLEDLVTKPVAPRAAWIMVPAATPPKNRSISSQADAIWRHHHRWWQLDVQR
jgi:6-phosphogluconate dehydrogenase